MTIMTMFMIAVLVGILIVLMDTFFVISQQTSGIVERLGKFSRVSSPGLNLKIPILEKIAGRINLRVRQLDVNVETKTKDNVFVSTVVSVQYYIREDKIYEAFYKLNDPYSQITAFVFDVVRARVPKMKLDDLFEKKDEIAIAVQDELAQVMENVGYGIMKALVTDINPDEKVKEAMNEINAAQRFRVAAEEKGEAEKILKVKSAEANAESKALEGQGIANQRRAIINGLQDSVDEFQKNITGASAQDVMNLVLMTQYFDTLKDIGADSETNTILIPHSPGYLNDISDNLRNSMLQANQVGKVSGEKKRS